MHIETEVRGVDSLVIRVRGEQERLQEHTRSAIAAAQEAAHAVWQMHVPRNRQSSGGLSKGKGGSGGMLPHGGPNRLAASIQKGPISFHPGGLGGGGFWEAELNVGEGVEYFASVVEGSGVFGAAGAGSLDDNPLSGPDDQRIGADQSTHAVTGNIGPFTAHGWYYGTHYSGTVRNQRKKPLAIQKGGEGVHFRMWQSGQRPQDEWLRLGQEAADAVIQAAVNGI